MPRPLCTLRHHPAEPWLATRYVWLEFFGFLTILAGIACVTLGTAFLIVHGLGRWRRFGRKPGWRELAAALLLAANFPAAGAIVYAVNYVQSATTCTVRNVGTAAVTSLKISNGFRSVEFGSIAPGASSSRTIHWIAGPLRFTRVQNGRQTKGIVVGTEKMDGDAVESARSGGVVIETNDAAGVAMK